MANYPELRGRIVLVTGGANGIPAATVRAFVDQGARVYFCDRDQERGLGLAKATGADFEAVDLTKEERIVAWIGLIAERERQIHVLVNSAARDPRITFTTMSAGQWDDLFAVNLRAYFLCAREALKAMRDGEGAIINLASITFYNAPSEMAAYVATKGGVIGFTRSLARELGPRRLRVNTVSPGWVMTERQLRDYVTPAARDLIMRSQCIPEFIQPEEIGEVILFLAADASRAITGQEILTDRGWCYS